MTEAVSSGALASMLKGPPRNSPRLLGSSGMLLMMPFPSLAQVGRWAGVRPSQWDQRSSKEEEEVGTPLLFLSINGFNEISGAATEGRQTGSKQAE